MCGKSFYPLESVALALNENNFHINFKGIAILSQKLLILTEWLLVLFLSLNSLGFEYSLKYSTLKEIQGVTSEILNFLLPVKADTDI